MCVPPDIGTPHDEDDGYPTTPSGRPSTAPPIDRFSERVSYWLQTMPGAKGESAPQLLLGSVLGLIFRHPNFDKLCDILDLHFAPS